MLGFVVARGYSSMVGCNFIFRNVGVRNVSILGYSIVRSSFYSDYMIRSIRNSGNNQQRWYCVSYSSGEESESDEEEVIETKNHTTIKPKRFPKGSSTAETWGFIEDYKKNGEIPPVDLFYKVLESYVYKKWIKRSLLVLDQMEEHGPIPNTDCYNIVMQFYLSNDAIDKIEDILERMYKIGTSLNLKTMEILFSMAEINNNLGMMEGLFTLLDDDKMRMNRFIYQKVITTYANNNKIQKALNFIRQEAKNRIQPNIESCNILLQVYMEQEKMKKAQKVFDLMTEFNLRANHRTYELTLLGYIATEHYGEADRLFNEMKLDLPFISQATYSIMMQKCFSQRDVAGAMEYFDIIFKSGDTIDDGLYYICIRGICENDDVEMAKTMFMKLLEDDIPYTIEIIEILLKCYMKNKEFGDAQALLELVENSEIELKSSIYEIMIESCMDNKLFDQALIWMKQLRKLESNYSPTKEFFDQIIEGSLEEQGVRLTVEEIKRELEIFGDPATSEEAQKMMDYEMEMELKKKNIFQKMRLTRNYLPSPDILAALGNRPSLTSPAKRFSQKE